MLAGATLTAGFSVCFLYINISDLTLARSNTALFTIPLVPYLALTGGAGGAAVLGQNAKT